MFRKMIVSVAVVLWVLGQQASAGTLMLSVPASGDAVYHWNTKYPGESYYSTGGSTMGATLQFNSPYGNDFWVAIWEIPIASLASHKLSSATLQVDCLGCGTWYYYGSVRIGWLDTGSMALSGDIVADGMGPVASAVPGHFTIYDTYTVPCTPGVISLDVLSYIQQDIAAGRSWSSFVMSASRDTSGDLYTAESGRGPVLLASGDSIVVPTPGPASMVLVGLAGVVALCRRRRAS